MASLPLWMPIVREMFGTRVKIPKIRASRSNKESAGRLSFALFF